MKYTICSLAAVCLLASAAQADIIGKWTFEDGTPSQLPATWGSSTVSGGGGNAVGSSWSSPSFALNEIGTGNGQAGGVHASVNTQWMSPAGNGSQNAFSSSHWTSTVAGDRYYSFSVLNINPAYSGWGQVKVSYDHTGSGTGPKNWDFQYSTDNSSFITFGTYDLLGTGWSSGTPNNANQLAYDLSAVTGINTSSTLYFRVVANSVTTAGAITGVNISTAGTSRIDNFIVSIPEPASLSLLGSFALLAWVVSRRRK